MPVPVENANHNPRTATTPPIAPDLRFDPAQWYITLSTIEGLRGTIGEIEKDIVLVREKHRFRSENLRTPGGTVLLLMPANALPQDVPVGSKVRLSPSSLLELVPDSGTMATITSSLGNHNLSVAAGGLVVIQDKAAALQVFFKSGTEMVNMYAHLKELAEKNPTSN